MTSPLDRLSQPQRSLLDSWLPNATVEHDHSWDIGTTVLAISHSGQRYILKAGSQDGMGHHFKRELEAHATMISPWTAIGRAPRLIHSSLEDMLILTEYLPGELVMSHPSEDPNIYRQAGELLALLHDQPAVISGDYEANENARSLKWLDGEHRIHPEMTKRLRDEITSWPTPPALLVPTHGDYHSRNWLVHEGVVSIIDFGRGALRPRVTDFGRLEVDGAFVEGNEEAFIRGYGADPRAEDPAAWRRERIRKAISIAAWAYSIRDYEFEDVGLRRLLDLMK